MKQAQRMHPTKILNSIVKMVKNSAIFLLYVMITSVRESSPFNTYVRLAILLFIVIRLLAIIVEWWQTRYLFTDETVHLQRGLFQKRQQDMQLKHIQNIQRETPFYYKIFNVTALTLNTKGTDDKASITLEAVTRSEAERIEQLLMIHHEKTKQARDEAAGQVETTSTDPNIRSSESNQPDNTQFESITEQPKYIDGITTGETEQQTPPSQCITIHFQPTKKELFKASFLSLSFLIVIPILYTMYEKIDDVISVDRYISPVFQWIKTSWLTIMLTGLTLIMIAIVIGIVRTYLTYGNYEIASDTERIYLKSGLLNEKSLSIRKGNVQAIRVHQSLIKRWLQMSEIMLVSTGGEEDDVEDIHSLFPFLPTKRAFSLTHELLPAFQMQTQLQRLPRRALYMKMLRIPWFFLIVSAILLAVKPAWWFVLPVLFVLTYVSRYFDYRNTYYMMDKSDMQFKSGGIYSVSFITTRQHIIEIAVKQSVLQKWFGLATIQTFNQATPVHEEAIKDVPVEVADQFMYWYGKRFSGIEIES